jgi:hypothetical protein
MPDNLLKNAGFEADWGEEKSHRCLIFPAGEASYEKEVGNIFTPPGWVTWFRHKPGTWDQPEVTDMHKVNFAERVRTGGRGMRLFTFNRGHDGGFFQRVQVTPGTKLKFTAWAHAWSNHPLPGHDDCTGNGLCSVGVGEGAFFQLTDETPGEDRAGPSTGDSWVDAVPNFSFWVGIDPTGGTDPTAGTVVWGQGAHIYNVFAQVPAAEATAQGDIVTVFLRSKTKWKFRHNDAYWDDAELVVAEGDGDGGDGGDGSETVPPPEAQLSYQPDSPKIGDELTVEARSLTALTNVALEIRQPLGAKLATGPVNVGRDGAWRTWTYATSPLSEVGMHAVTFTASDGVEKSTAFECAPAPAPTPAPPPEPERGLPREQYERTYVLLPPTAGAAWALAVADATWDDRRYTIGSSADDAGIGNLDARRVIAVNPQDWGDDLQAFFEQHYAGVDYIPIVARTPAELAQKLEQLP